MSPAFKSVVIPLSEVPREDLIAATEKRKPVVLVVDDEHLVADTLAIIFKHAGFRAYARYDAAAALDLAGVVLPDILVSDVDMPMMDGVELALTLLKRLPTCRVLLFSGHATFADLAAARAAGYEFPLLPKPVHPAEMLRNVLKCLGAAVPRPRMSEDRRDTMLQTA